MAEKMQLVRDLMHIGVTTCGADTPFTEAVRTLVNENLESMIVLDENGHSAGVFSRREAVAAFGQSGASINGYATLTVAEVMRPDIPELPPDIPATVAAQMMLDYGVREIHLMHHASGMGWPAAVLRFDDILRYLAAETEEETTDMGAGATRKTPIDVFKERYSIK